MKQTPEAGTVMWFVVEHRYYKKGEPAPRLEYCLVSGPVKMWGDRGIKIKSWNPDGFYSLHYFYFDEIGKRCFDNPQEAAARARELTEKHERSCLGASDVPIRRSWAHYLENSG